MNKDETFLYLIYIDANHVMIGPPGFWGITLRLFGISYICFPVFTLCHLQKSLFTHFFRTGIDDLATGSDDLLGLIGFLFVTKYFLEKKRELKCFFSSWGHHWGLSCIYGEVYKLYFPYFTFMNYWLKVNLNHYEFGLITPISTHLGPKGGPLSDQAFLQHWILPLVLSRVI